jgi:hypothetical protein
MSDRASTQIKANGPALWQARELQDWGVLWFTLLGLVQK